jgi:hypothetical protein
MMCGTPHPGCFWKRGCKRLKTEEASVEDGAREKKRRQAAEDKRVEREGTAQRALRPENLDVEKKHRAMQIDVKTKEL